MSVSDKTTELATQLIKQAEGYHQHQYKDNAKQENPTIYWGHKILPGEKFNNTKEEAEKIFKKDLEIAINRAKNSCGDTFDKLSAQRQAVLIDMSFNIGKISFPNMIKNTKDGLFPEAALDLLESKYRVQIKSRAYRNAYILKQGVIITREQALQKAVRDGILDKNKQNKINYSGQVKDGRINNILSQTKTDTDLANQLEAMKKANVNVGGVSFDFDPLITRLNGMVIDEKNIKIVGGDIYDQSNFSFMDMVVPLKIMYDPEIKSKNISVSLDPYILTQPDGPWYRKVFYPKQLATTNYGQQMISADYLMKQLSLGVDEDNNPFPYSDRLLKIGIDIHSIFKSIEQDSHLRSRTRLWIVIKDYEVLANQKFFQVKNVKMGVELKALEISQNGSLRDCNDDPSPISKKFCELFTQHYDELAQIYPILNKMKRLAKASIMAKLMYFKRVPVDMDLINRLYKKQMTQSEQKLPRLQNKLKKQLENMHIQLQVLGGCTFDISNMQQKIKTLEKQIKEVRQFYTAKNLNSNTMPLKALTNTQQKIGQFLFINNEKDQISNNKIYPFLFQTLLKCKYCDKLCNLDYYSVTNKQCYDHSSMKCKICNVLIMPGEEYKINKDKTMTFHTKCFKCTSCKNKIEGPFANVDGGQYHPECVPKKLIGMCDQCKKEIYQGEACAQNPQTSVFYHGECAKILNQRILDSIPNCKFCNVKLQGPYVKYKDDSYHEQCAKKMLMSNQ